MLNEKMLNLVKTLFFNKIAYDFKFNYFNIICNIVFRVLKQMYTPTGHFLSIHHLIQFTTTIFENFCIHFHYIYWSGISFTV